MAELIAIGKAMREIGALKYAGHGIEILLGPEPIPKDEKKKKEADPRASKRSHYMNLLGRTPSDAELDMLPD